MYVLGVTGKPWRQVALAMQRYCGSLGKVGTGGPQGFHSMHVGFKVQGLGFRFRVQTLNPKGLGLRVKGLGSGIKA